MNIVYDKNRELCLPCNSAPLVPPHAFSQDPSLLSGWCHDKTQSQCFEHFELMAQCQNWKHISLQLSWIRLPMTPSSSCFSTQVWKQSVIMTVTTLVIGNMAKIMNMVNMSNKFNPGNMINPSWLPYSTFSSVFHNKAKRAQQGNLLDQPFCNQITFIRQHVQHDQPRQHDHDGSQLHELHSTLYLSHYPRPQPHRGHRSNISKIDHKDMRLKIVKRQICKKKYSSLQVQCAAHLGSRWSGSLVFPPTRFSLQTGKDRSTPGLQLVHEYWVFEY